MKLQIGTFSRGCLFMALFLAKFLNFQLKSVKKRSIVVILIYSNLICVCQSDLTKQPKSVQVPQISADQLCYSCQAISDNSTNLLVISYTSNIMMHLIVTSARKNTKIIWLHWFTMFQRATSPRIRYLDKLVNELVAVDGSGANIAFNMI